MHVGYALRLSDHHENNRVLDIARWGFTQRPACYVGAEIQIEGGDAVPLEAFVVYSLQTLRTTSKQAGPAAKTVLFQAYKREKKPWQRSVKEEGKRSGKKRSADGWFGEDLGASEGGRGLALPLETKTVEILEEEEEVRAERAPGGGTPHRPQGRERRGDDEKRGTPQRADPETGGYETRAVHVGGDDMFDVASPYPGTKRTVESVSGTPLGGQMSNTGLEQWARQPAPSEGTSPAKTTTSALLDASAMDSGGRREVGFALDRTGPSLQPVDSAGRDVPTVTSARGRPSNSVPANKEAEVPQESHLLLREHLRERACLVEVEGRRLFNR
ncbi:hypothetical protein PInf_022415 [Phytophthora infestans]|nr:hypothetical protein PInf_022415 [Phytophthora infestans]